MTPRNRHARTESVPHSDFGAQEFYDEDDLEELDEKTDAGDLAELLGHSGQALPTARHQNQVMVVLRQLPRQLEPDSGRGAGDQCGSHSRSLASPKAASRDRAPRAACPQAS